VEAVALVAALLVVYLVVRRLQQARDDKRSLELRARLDAIDQEWKQDREKALLTDKGEGKRPRDWNVRRQIVLERDGYRCVRCGATSHLHIHHIVKRSKAIDHSTQNLVTLCVHCHAKEDGHGSGLVSTQAAWSAHRKGYDRRRGRKVYICSKCACEIAKGEVSFPQKATNSYGLWIAVKERLCEKCMLNS
jgi:5-methylcytosine-specific restriction endonuclease McrA